MLITIWTHFNITLAASQLSALTRGQLTEVCERSVSCVTAGWAVPSGLHLSVGGCLVWFGAASVSHWRLSVHQLDCMLTSRRCDSTGYTQYQTFTSFHWQLFLIEEGNFLNKKLCPHSNPRGRTLMVALCVYTVVPLSRSGEMSSSELPRCHWDQNK